MQLIPFCAVILFKFRDGNLFNRKWGSNRIRIIIASLLFVYSAVLASHLRIYIYICVCVYIYLGGRGVGNPTTALVSIFLGCEVLYDSVGGQDKT